MEVAHNGILLHIHSVQKAVARVLVNFPHYGKKHCKAYTEQYAGNNALGVVGRAYKRLNQNYTDNRKDYALSRVQNVVQMFYFSVKIIACAEETEQHEEHHKDYVTQGTFNV